MGKRVLIIDDEAILRTSLEQYLEDFGFVTKSVGSGQQALEILEADGGFDVAVVDLRMPGMGGEELIIKAHKMRPALKYIIQTGTLAYQPSPELVEIGLREGNVLKKPVLRLDTYIDLINKLAD